MILAIVGTRGIPARYGGFETFAEELSRRLVERGHQVTVYCRQRPPGPVYRGVRLCYLPTLRHKYFDTLVHTFLSTLHLSLYLPATPINRLSIAIAPFIGTTMVSEANIMVTDFVGMGVGALTVQIIVLEFFEQTMLKIFLPLGILLRAFFLTRRVGSTLIALSIACFFVFPVSVMMFEQVVKNAEYKDYGNYMNLVRMGGSVSPGKAQAYHTQMMDEGRTAGLELLKGSGRDKEFNWFLLGDFKCTGENNKWYQNAICTIWIFVNGIGTSLTAAWTFMGKIFSMVALFLASGADGRKFALVLFFGAIEAMDQMSAYLTFVVVGLVMEIIITITAFRSISSVIGGEVEIFGLAKLV